MNATFETTLSVARAWAGSDPDVETQHELEELLLVVDAGDTTATDFLIQRFTGRLAFGTAGIRARLGIGPH